MEKKTASSTHLGKILSLSLVLLLLTAGHIPIASTHNAPFPSGYDPSSLVIDTISEPESLDPAWANDKASDEIIFNVYETMVFYDVAWSDGPYTAGKADQFKPLLATSWTWTSGPAPYVKTITFTIRSGVTFHDGATLTPADVEYSWERCLVQDRDGGPQWMIYYPMLGIYGADDPTTDPNFGDKINNAITSTASTVSIHLMTDFPETIFLQIMCRPWAGVVEKAWAIAKGDFDGNWAAGWETIYGTWHNPENSFIEGDMMGTGPYKFDYWVHGTAYSIVKYDNYWDGWPARVYRQPSSNNERLVDFISRATWNLFASWTTRRARFLAGDADLTTVPRQYRDQILGQIVGGEPVRCFYPVEPQIAVDAIFFTFDINPQSPYLGPGFDPANPYAIAEDRIPTNLFSDIHMRRGFRYAFDWALFLSSAYLGEATQPADPIIPGLSYDNPANALPIFDLVKAQQELQAAFGGQIWANGMTFTLLFNSGNVARETAVTMLANNINGLNEKFHLIIQEVAWGSTYLPQMVARMLPLFSSGWQVDYADPDNFAFPFMHTYGTFGGSQGYNNPRVDELIEAGALMPVDTAAYNGELDLPNLAALEAEFNNPGGIPPDTRWPRRSIYYELQALYTEDVPGFALSQEVGRHWELAWMRGWYYNPLYPGEYIYHRWKAATHFGDINNDGEVDIYDLSFMSSAWSGVDFFNPAADLTGGSGGTPDAGTGLVSGIPDGKLTVSDSAFLGAHWDGPPLGPSHPQLFEGSLQPSSQRPPLEQPFPIGETIQTNPFESNPADGVTSGVVGLIGTVSAAMDGDFGSNLNWRIGGALSSVTAYVQLTPFENTPPTAFNIGWVDIKMDYRASIATTASMDDRYRIVYQVAPSTAWLVLQDWTNGNAARFNINQQQDERAWSNVAEPNDGVWDWTDIGNVKVRVETQRQGGTEDLLTNRFYLYDVWLTIYKGTYPSAGNLSIQPQVVTGLSAGDIFFVDVFVTDVVNMHGFQFFITYNTTVLEPFDYFAYNPFIFDAPSEIDNAIGQVSMAFCSHMGDRVGFTGSGPVYRIYFLVVADGGSELHFKRSKLASTHGRPIAHTESDGLFVTLADVAITDITPSKTLVGQNYPVLVNVTAQNQGLYKETFDVTAYYDSNIIGTQTVNDLPPGNSIVLTFTWDTTGVAKNDYTISASATPVLGETETIDNTLTDGTVKVVTPGDVNADGKVDVIDAGGVSAHWYPGPPIGPLGYDVNFDINGDGHINVLDAGIVSAYWTGPPKGPLDP